MSFLMQNSAKASKQIARVLCLNRLEKAQRLVNSFVQQRAYAQANTKNDAPVKFSTSKAKSYDPTITFISTGGDRQQPRYQPFIISFFLVVMFVYFVLIREENELDELMMRPLEDVVPNIKEQTLMASIANYERMGLDTRELKEALKIEIEKNAKKKAALAAQQANDQKKQ
jgi:hypothetical protein